MSDTKSKYDKDKRAKRLRSESQEEWKTKIDFSKTLTAISKAEDAVQKIAESGELAAWRVLLDSKWKRINKLLPDVRATENTHEMTGDLFRDVQINVIAREDRG